MQEAEPGADEMYCSGCGTLINKQAETCVNCGSQVCSAPPVSPADLKKPGLDEMYCSSCGSIIKRRAVICVKCGVKVSGNTPAAPAVVYSEKSRLAAGLLGILLGGLGVHRFYLGNIGMGILQIAVFLITLGIGGIWGLVEGIIIASGANWKDGKGRPLKQYNQ